MLFSKYNNEDFTPLLDFLENWFIRRNITNYPATNSLDQMFLELIGKCQNNYSFEEIKNHMLDGKFFMANDEYKKFLTEKDLYEGNTNALMCLMVKIEKSFRNKEIEVDFWRKNKDKLVWSIEHIMPQKPKKDSCWENIDKEAREENIHKLGNLTLTCYNSNLSNKTFPEKKELNVCNNQIGFNSGNIKINDCLKDKTDWTIEDIRNRSEYLANIAIKF